MSRLCALVVLVATAAWSFAAEPELPTLVAPAGAELHGTFNGQPFWLRQHPYNEQFAGHKLELVYSPPAREALGGVQLVDHPFILIDAHGRVMAWNERQNGQSGAQYKDRKDGYLVMRQIQRGTGADALDVMRRGQFPDVDPSWDERILPLLAALTWTSDANAAASLVDLYGPTAPASRVTLKGSNIQARTFLFSCVADEQGTLKTLKAADGRVILEVAERKALTPDPVLP